MENKDYNSNTTTYQFPCGGVPRIRAHDVTHSVGDVKIGSSDFLSGNTMCSPPSILGNVIPSMGGPTTILDNCNPFIGPNTVLGGPYNPYVVKTDANPFAIVNKKKEHSHYFKDVSKFTTIDVYRVLDLFNVTDPAIAHAAKKLLVAGGRGAGKDINKDIKEAIDTLVRWQEMQKENNA